MLGFYRRLKFPCQSLLLSTTVLNDIASILPLDDGYIDMTKRFLYQ